MIASRKVKNIARRVDKNLVSLASPGYGSSQRYAVSLIPPSLASGTEIILGPVGKEDFAIVRHIAVRQCQGQRSRSTDDGAIGSVLGSVARAHELVGGSGPRNDTTQMSAHGVQTVIFKRFVLLNNQVSFHNDQKCNMLGKVRLYPTDTPRIPQTTQQTFSNHSRKLTWHHPSIPARANDLPLAWMPSNPWQ
jgi:hypothetical protein